MLYTHFNKNEIDQITEILNQYTIKHEVHVNEDMIADQNEKSKYIINRHGEQRRSSAFYNIIIEKEDFDQLPADAVKKLERLNIYPDFTDVPFEAESEVITPVKIADEKSKLVTVLAIFFGVTIFGFAALNWVDNYVIKVFPRKGKYEVIRRERMFDGQLIDW